MQPPNVNSIERSEFALGFFTGAFVDEAYGKSSQKPIDLFD